MQHPGYGGPSVVANSVVAALVGVFLAIAAPAVAAEADDLVPLSLAPLPLLRPAARVVDEEPVPLAGACGDGSLAMVADRLPWGPGERLTWDITVLGVRAGRIGLAVAERTTVDGLEVYPFRARARTDQFLAALGVVDASMVSFIDPRSSTPVRMANHVVTRAMFSSAPAVTREDAAFAPSTISPAGPRGGRVASVIDHKSEGKHLRKKTRATSRADIVDVLAIVPWLRSRELVEGRRFCVELFHRRRLFRVEGVVGNTESVDVPLGRRRGRVVHARVLRALGREPRPLEIWISDDIDHVPLLLRTPDALGTLEIRLAAHTRGRALVRGAGVTPIDDDDDDDLRGDGEGAARAGSGGGQTSVGVTSDGARRDAASGDAGPPR